VHRSHRSASFVNRPFYEVQPTSWFFMYLHVSSILAPIQIINLQSQLCAPSFIRCAQNSSQHRRTWGSIVKCLTVTSLIWLKYAKMHIVHIVKYCKYVILYIYVCRLHSSIPSLVERNPLFLTFLHDFRMTLGIYIYSSTVLMPVFFV